MWSKWEDDDEHGQEYGCVLRKPTLSQKSGDDSQRHKPFRTRCITQGNVFELIIDSGSYREYY